MKREMLPYVVKFIGMEYYKVDRGLFTYSKNCIQKKNRQDSRKLQENILSAFISDLAKKKYLEVFQG